jgi:hypothetical protein
VVDQRRLASVITWSCLALVALLSSAWFAAGVFGWHYCTDFRKDGSSYYMRCYEPRSSVVGAAIFAALGLVALAVAIRGVRLRRHS